MNLINNETTEEKIIEATFKILQKEGVKKATTKKIAAEAGVNEITIFRKFKTKKNLIEIVKEHYMKIFIDKIENIFDFSEDEEIDNYLTSNFNELLNLTDEDSLDLDAHTNIITYFLDVVFTSLATNEDVYYRAKDFARIINIPTLNINPTDFNLSKEDKDKLFKSGFNSAKSFIKDWNFDRYLSRYCTRKNIYKIKNT